MGGKRRHFLVSSATGGSEPPDTDSFNLTSNLCKPFFFSQTTARERPHIYKFKESHLKRGGGVKKRRTGQQVLISHRDEWFARRGVKEGTLENKITWAFKQVAGTQNNHLCVCLLRQICPSVNKKASHSTNERKHQVLNFNKAVVWSWSQLCDSISLYGRKGITNNWQWILCGSQSWDTALNVHELKIVWRCPEAY